MEADGADAISSKQRAGLVRLSRYRSLPPHPAARPPQARDRPPLARRARVMAYVTAPCGRLPCPAFFTQLGPIAACWVCSQPARRNAM